jgi:threonine synthase
MRPPVLLSPIEPEMMTASSIDGAGTDPHAVARDPQAALSERLDAFEDLFESDVGDTDLIRARNLEKRYGLSQLFLKFEGSNPSGTQKDRIAYVQVADALRRGFDSVCVASCGNYGVAVALAASQAGLRAVVYIPEGYHTRRLDELEELGASVVRAGSDYEHSVVLAREHADKHGVYDANPGGANATLQLRAYGEIAHEVYDELRDAPRVAAVPVSNGTTLAGVHRGFVSLFRRGKTSRIPAMIGGSSHRKNPVVHAVLSGLDRCMDLDPESIHETVVNEPLVNWHASDGDPAFGAIRSSGGGAAEISDKRMLQMSKELREAQGLDVLPAATAGLCALLALHERQALPSDRYLAVLTGRNDT